MTITRRSLIAGATAAAALSAFPINQSLASSHVVWYLERPDYGHPGNNFTAGAMRLTSANAKDATKDAIERARMFFESNTNTVLFLRYPAGRFVFGNPGTASGYAILVRNIRPTGGRLVFLGAGIDRTTFVISNNQGKRFEESQWGIYLFRSERISFRQIHVTVPQRTVTQGRVVDQHLNDNPRTILLDIDPGHENPRRLLRAGNPNGAGRYLRRYWNRDDPRIDTHFKQVGWSDIQYVRASSQANSPGVFRFILNSASGLGLNNNNLVGIKGKAGGDPYRAFECHGVEFESMRFTRKTRGLFLRCGQVRLSNIVMPRQYVNGKPACLASPDGGPQFHERNGGVVDRDECTRRFGVNVVIENCNFLGTGDDCIGLFEQRDTLVRNCYMRDSFGRGLYMHRCDEVMYPGLRAERAELLHENPTNPC